MGVVRTVRISFKLSLISTFVPALRLTLCWLYTDLAEESTCRWRMVKCGISEFRWNRSGIQKRPDFILFFCFFLSTRFCFILFVSQQSFFYTVVGQIHLNTSAQSKKITIINSSSHLRCKSPRDVTVSHLEMQLYYS